MIEYFVKLFSNRRNLNKIQDLLYPIIMNLRPQKYGNFNYKLQDKDVVIQTPEGETLLRIPAFIFLEEAEKLLKAINDRAGVFSISDTESFMQKLYCKSIKAKSSDKTDIRIILHDQRSKTDSEMSFSIKSQLGKASTLLNPGETTNILYRVEGHELSDEQIISINSIEDHLPRMKAIYDLGCYLQYENVVHETFKNNLLFLDSNMPQFIADCLLISSLPDSILHIHEIVKKVTERNPLHFTGKNVETFYEHKMKVLLIDVALGMTPAKEWNGRYDANGGYIVVRKDGEIVCYHFYNRNDIEDYLYYNTCFDRASRGRYKFGTLFRGKDSKVYIKLNLQIRFIK